VVVLFWGSVPSSGQMFRHFGGTHRAWRLGQWISWNGFPGMLNLIPICLSSQAAVLSCDWPNTHKLLCTTSAFIWGSSVALKMEAVCSSEMSARVTITPCQTLIKRHHLVNNCREDWEEWVRSAFRSYLLGKLYYDHCQVDACCCRVDLRSLRKRGLERCPAL
jgi:hypothetical protein